MPNVQRDKFFIWKEMIIVEFAMGLLKNCPMLLECVCVCCQLCALLLYSSVCYYLWIDCICGFYTQAKTLYIEWHIGSWWHQHNMGHKNWKLMAWNGSHRFPRKKGEGRMDGHHVERTLYRRGPYFICNLRAKETKVTEKVKFYEKSSRSVGIIAKKMHEKPLKIASENRFNAIND